MSRFCDLARFTLGWQGIGGAHRGPAGLTRAIEQLSGVVLPASALESLILPARVGDYAPALLDEAMSTGEILWRGHGSLPGDDGWISLHLADTAHLTMAPPSTTPLSDLATEVLAALGAGGSWFFRSIAERVGSCDDPDVLAALWDLVWSGQITGDGAARCEAWAAPQRDPRSPLGRGRRPPSVAGRSCRGSTLTPRHGLWPRPRSCSTATAS